MAKRIYALIVWSLICIVIVFMIMLIRIISALFKGADMVVWKIANLVAAILGRFRHGHS